MRLINADELVTEFRRAINSYVPKDPTRHMNSVDAFKCHGWIQGLLVIQNAPTITPEPHWIPVTERLPNRDELVLVTYKTTSKIHLCKYLDDGSENSWWSYIDYCCAWNNVILAWMPLPEPIKEVT